KQFERVAPVLGQLDAETLLLQRPGDEEAVYPVVVDHQHAAGCVHLGSSSATSAYSASIRVARPSAPVRSPLRASISSSRHDSEKRVAPNVAPFDFSVCAAR